MADMQRRWRNLGLLAGVLAAAALAIVPAQSWRQGRAAEHAFDTGNISKKGSALRSLARLRTRHGDAIVLEALSSPDPALRTHAGYAISSTDRMDLADELRAAWEREDEPAVRSGMIFDWTQLVEPDAAEPLLGPMLASQDPWTVLAAARARLRRGDPAAAEKVLSLAAAPDPALQNVAQKELLYMSAPMSAILGQILPVDDEHPALWSQEELSRVKAWWDGHITPRLLRDYAAWRLDKPDAWNKASVLVYAWRTRVKAVLPASEAEEKKSNAIDSR
jgi:hypothetical protein